jgi:hypothetical protein
VLVGSLSIGAGYQLHHKFIAAAGRFRGGSAAVGQSSSPTGVGDRSVPERQQDTVANDASAGPSPSSTGTDRVGQADGPDRPAHRTRGLGGQADQLGAAPRPAARRCGPTAGCAHAARSHSTDMARRDYFSHETPEGVTPWQRAEDAGYPNPAAENIAHGYPTAKTVVDAWTFRHRANISTALEGGRCRGVPAR